MDCPLSSRGHVLLAPGKISFTRDIARRFLFSRPAAERRDPARPATSLSDRRNVMDDEKQPVKPGNKGAIGKQPDMGPRDEAPPDTPGTGENIDPKTGEKYVEGIGGG
jgi:hypothetical protein